MLDLHCHILPEVDDGASSLEESLEMAWRYVKDGVSHLVATPHFHLGIRVERPAVLRHVARLNQDLAAAGVPLPILPGSEVQVVDVAAYRRDLEAGRFCHLGDGQDFTLLEFAWDAALYPPDAPDLMEWLRARGITPIVAHPERQPYLARDPAKLRSLLEAGAWLQVTVDSLLGNHGAAAQASGELLLRTYQDVVLATDAHDLGRCSGMSPGYAWVRDRLGAPRAEDLRARADRVLSALAGGG